MKKAKAAYACQKCGAKKRGIGWELTFEQWLAWWGEDINRRGNGQFDLQMQRYGDTGPYALGNIKKGTPKENRATWGRMHRNRQAEKARKEHEQLLDALMAAPSSPQDDFDGKDVENEFHLRNMSFPSKISNYGKRYAKDR